MADSKTTDSAFHPTPEQAEATFFDFIDQEQWNVLGPLFNAARQRGLQFALGGGLAFSLYSGYLRNTKDADIFVLPADRDQFLALMSDFGFAEYTEFDYDRRWSYRGVKDGVILDVLWGNLNTMEPVDSVWITAGWQLQLRGARINLIPPEEMVFSKLFVFKRERCDWPDLLRMIFSWGTELDWQRLLQRLGPHTGVLGSLLALFNWVCPGRSAALPSWLWERVGMCPPQRDAAGPDVHLERAAILKIDHLFTD